MESALQLAAVVAVSYITYRVLDTNVLHTERLSHWIRGVTFASEGFKFMPGSTITATKVGSDLWELDSMGGARKTMTSEAMKQYTTDPRYTMIYV